MASLALSLNDNRGFSLPPDRDHFPPSLDLFARRRPSRGSQGQSQSENEENGEETLTGGSFTRERSVVGDLGGPAAMSPTGSSALTQMIRSPGAGSLEDRNSHVAADAAEDQSGVSGGSGGADAEWTGPPEERESIVIDEPEGPQTERTSLLSKSYWGYGTAEDVENQGASNRPRPRNAFSRLATNVTMYARLLSSPKS